MEQWSEWHTDLVPEVGNYVQMEVVLNLVLGVDKKIVVEGIVSHVDGDTWRMVNDIHLGFPVVLVVSFYVNKWRRKEWGDLLENEEQEKIEEPT